MKYSKHTGFFTILQVFLLGCILFHILPCQAQSGYSLYISAHPDSTICEGDVLTLTAHCDCDDGDGYIINPSFSLLVFLHSGYGDTCNTCPSISPISSPFSNLAFTKNIFAAGNAIKLGGNINDYPNDYRGIITITPDDESALSHPFFIRILAKGWGDEPGKITVSVNGTHTQSFITKSCEWRANCYTADTLYFPAVTAPSAITIQTDTIHKPDGSITGYRAFIKEIQVKRICPHSWSTGNPIDTNAILVVSPDVDTSYTVTVFYSDVDSATASIHIRVNHPHGTSDTITECGSYTWNGTEYTESGVYYFDHLDANGCTQEDTLVLTIKEIPNVSISGRVNIIEGDMDSLTLSLQGTTHYEWYVGDVLMSEETVLASESSRIFPVEPLDTTTYTVIGTADGCADTASFTVNVIHCESWRLVTDASQLAVGDKIVITNQSANYALSTTQNTNNRAGTSITSNGNTITINNNVQLITLEQGTVGNSFAFHVNDGYLFAASSSSNHLQTQTTNDDNGSWRISISSNDATIVSQGTNTHNTLQYNAQNHLFSCYTSGQQAVRIYKLFSAYSDTTVTACNSFTLHNQTYNSSGSYTIVLPNAAANGCDSTIYLHLTILTEVHGPDTTAEACGSFTWHGETYTTPGDKEYHTTTAAGCDSIVTLHLKIKEIPNALITTNPATPIICEGESITLTGTTDCSGTEVILEEGFNGLGHGNTSPSGSYGPDNNPLTLPSNILSDAFDSGNNVFAAGDAVKLGTSKKTGSITSKELDLTQDYSVTIRAKGWVGTSTYTTSIKISATNCSNPYLFTVQGFSNCSFSDYQHDFNAATAYPSRLTIETTTTGSDKRAFIDYVKITKEVPCIYKWHTSSEVISSLDSISVSPSSTTWYYFSVTAPNGCVGVDSVEVVVVNETPATVTFDPGNGTCDTTSLTEEDCLSGITLPPAASCAPDYEFAGWTTAPVTSETLDTPDPLLPAGSHYNPSDDITLYAVYQRCDTIDGPYIYQLVTSDTTDWSGEYLIVCTERQKVWNEPAHSDALDAISVNIINHKIPFDSAPVYRFVIENMGNGYYSILDNNGYYMGKCSDDSRNCSNGNPVSNIIEYDNGNVNISVTAFPDCYITYRSDASVFGYYSRGYSSYFPIQLYRLTEDEFIVTCSYTSYPFYPSASSTEEACDSYTWHRTNAPDTTITNSGIYLHSHTEGGCSYVDTLKLTITSSPELTIIATPDTVICAGDSVTLQVMREVPRYISPVAVGDILCTDSSFVKPADWPEAYAAGKIAQGVVFYVDNTGQHGWAVNLQDDRSGITWSSVSTNPTLTNYSSSNNAIYNLEGYTNTQRIREAGNAATYPAAWAVEFDNGWYLPAAGQLRLLYAELVTINASLGIVGTPFLMDSNFPRYWSSTENNDNSRAWLVDHTGSVQNDSKSSSCNIRSVRNF